jgi:hypothetical protein
MPLTVEQKQTIRDEEYYRAEVRSEMATAAGQRTFFARVSTFLDSKAGFWLLTTALAGIAATGWTELRRYLDREDIARTRSAEAALRETETILKLSPMVFSKDSNQAEVAIILLRNLATRAAVTGQTASDVQAVFAIAIENGSRVGSTTEEKAAAAAVVRHAIDTSPLPSPDATSAPATPSGTPASMPTLVDKAILPPRVYIQIADESDRQTAEQFASALRAAAVVVPATQIVGSRRSPQQDGIRYCKEQASTDAIERVVAATKNVRQPAPLLNALPANLCGNVRFNHFELWLARPGAPTR